MFTRQDKCSPYKFEGSSFFNDRLLKKLPIKSLNTRQRQPLEAPIIKLKKNNRYLPLAQQHQLPQHSIVLSNFHKKANVA